MSAPQKTDKERLRDAEDLVRKKNAEIASLNRTVSNLQRENDTAEAIRQEIWGLSAHTVQPPEWISGKGGKLGSRGCPIVMVSDIHYGETINPDEVGGLNRFNQKIARDRLQRLFDITVDLSFNHMGRAKTEYPGIIACFAGDMVGGDIHEELLATNDRTTHQSVNELTDILAGGIEKLASSFGHVFVPCVVGNHGRSTKKMRMKGRVYTNYDWSIYCNLERHFRKEKRVVIHVPSEADAYFNSFGRRFMLTHGDSLGVKGGDGIIGAIGPIMRGSLKVGASEAQVGREFDQLLMGHWHQMLWLPGVIVNNSVKGYDEYARLQLRAKYSRPSQALFFHHPEHGITARWEMFLEGQKKAQEHAKWVTWQE